MSSAKGTTTPINGVSVQVFAPSDFTKLVQSGDKYRENGKEYTVLEKTYFLGDDETISSIGLIISEGQL
ncbi:hypothetical protein C4K00_0476 [Pseudomonas synxantha]|nr:hypothetical protein C4K00_0476 [Pseudomonas synxantha]AZE76280.1 hypothetical protein C4J99_0465 [Pseudomonas synxantha]